MREFQATVNAFMAVEESTWSIVDALVEDLPGDTSARDVEECRQVLSEFGIKKSASTIIDYRSTGRFLERASASESVVLRTQSVSTVREFARAGWTPECAVNAIAEFQNIDGDPTSRMGSDVARRLVRPQCGGTTTKPPEEWDEAEWQKFDAKVLDTLGLLVRAVHLQDCGLYKPSGHAQLLLAMLKEQPDLDAELAALLEQAGQ